MPDNWYVTVEAYDQDGTFVVDRFTVEAEDEHEARYEAHLAAEDCGWTNVETQRVRPV
jgi:hypothetical protein